MSGHFVQLHTCHLADQGLHVVSALCSITCHLADQGLHVVSALCLPSLNKHSRSLS